MYTIEREFEISCGHRVFGHLDKHGNPGKCSRLHGHSYRITIVMSAAQLNDLGMVLDFADIKDKVENKVVQMWDHKMLIWQEDSIAQELAKLDSTVFWTAFNPTAENMARYILDTANAEWLPARSGVTVTKVIVQETAKCKAYYTA